MNNSALWPTPMLSPVSEQAIRNLRVWHWEQYLLHQKRSMTVFLDLREHNIAQATRHMKAVQALNDIVSGTAETDLLLKDKSTEWKNHYLFAQSMQHGLLHGNLDLADDD